MKIRRRCKCGCGSITTIYRGKARKYISGHNTSHFKHRLYKHKIYRVWQHMKERCYNPNTKQFKDWGGRGIRVCIRWRRSFKSFYNWAIKNGYKEGLEIDRQDNDGNYTPDNCRFVTNQISSCNQRIRKDNNSGYRGVSFYKHHNKYITQITSNKKRKHIGYFKTAKQAAEARDKYIIENNLPNKLNFTNNYQN